MAAEAQAPELGVVLQISGAGVDEDSRLLVLTAVNGVGAARRWVTRRRVAAVLRL